MVRGSVRDSRSEGATTAAQKVAVPSVLTIAPVDLLKIR